MGDVPRAVPVRSAPSLMRRPSSPLGSPRGGGGNGLGGGGGGGGGFSYAAASSPGNGVARRMGSAGAGGGREPASSPGRAAAGGSDREVDGRGGGGVHDDDGRDEGVVEATRWAGALGKGLGVSLAVTEAVVTADGDAVKGSGGGGGGGGGGSGGGSGGGGGGGSSGRLRVDATLSTTLPVTATIPANPRQRSGSRSPPTRAITVPLSPSLSPQLTPSKVLLMKSGGGGGGGGGEVLLSPPPAPQPLRALKDSAPLTRRALASCVAYGLSSTTSTLLNKTVFSQATFHYPWFTLACQNVMSVLLLGVLARLGVIRWSGFSPRLCRQLLVPIAFFVLFIFSNAQALRYVSLPVLTVLKSTGPIAVTLFERSVFRDVFPPAVYASMLLVLASTVVTAAGDLAFSATGYGWAAANVAANVGYLASLRHFVRGGGGHTPLEMTLHSNLLALAPILPLSWASGELPSAAPSSLAATSGWFLAAYVASGMLTTAICASGFWCLRETNGSTYSFLGGLNKIPIVVLGSLLFDAPVSAQGWAGVALSIVAGVLFVRSKAVVREGHGGSPGEEGGGGGGTPDGGGGTAGATGTSGTYRRVAVSAVDGGGHAATSDGARPGVDLLGTLEVVVGAAGDKGGGGKAANRHVANISSGR